MKICGVAALTYLMFGSAAAFACASCGSGTDDPLMLYPNEKLKVYQSVSVSGGFRNINPDGSVSSPGAIRQRLSLSVFGGIGLSMRTALTAGFPVIHNLSETDAQTGLGDPVFTLRHSLVLQTLANPLIPQVQAIMSYRPGLATSIYSSARKMDLLDAYGSGFDEWRIGLDVWQAMTSWKIGAAHFVSFSASENYAGSTIQPGPLMRTILSLGYGWSGGTRLTGGITRDQRQATRRDGFVSNGTDHVNHSLFLSSDLGFGPHDAAKLTLSRQAALFRNRNTFAANTVSMAWTRSI